MVEQQQRSLACAAAAHHVLDRHPDAEVLVFAVKDGQPTMLANVLDGADRYLPARRTGDWADTVRNEIRHEAAAVLAGLDGVEATGTTLHVSIRTVVAEVAHLVSDEPRCTNHSMRCLAERSPSRTQAGHDHIHSTSA
jgi:hypothetical protein